MIGEGHIPAIHCKMCLKGHKSMRKVDGLSLIFIDYFVPALTPLSTFLSLHMEYLIRHGPHRKHCVQQFLLRESVYRAVT
jgi:hypothetical protein